MEVNIFMSLMRIMFSSCALLFNTENEDLPSHSGFPCLILTPSALLFNIAIPRLMTFMSLLMIIPQPGRPQPGAKSQLDTRCYPAILGKKFEGTTGLLWWSSPEKSEAILVSLHFGYCFWLSALVGTWGDFCVSTVASGQYSSNMVNNFMFKCELTNWRGSLGALNYS